MVNRFNEHADQYHLLPSGQSASRKFHSTETAITIVHSDIVRAIDDGDVSALILSDLSSSFNTIDHDMLLDVLNLRWYQGSCASLVQLIPEKLYTNVLCNFWDIISSHTAMQCSSEVCNLATEAYRLHGGHHGYYRKMFYHSPFLWWLYAVPEELTHRRYLVDHFKFGTVCHRHRGMVFL